MGTLTDILGRSAQRLLVSAGIFLAFLGRGPRAFLIGKISGVNPKVGKIL